MAATAKSDRANPHDCEDGLAGVEPVDLDPRHVGERDGSPRSLGRPLRGADDRVVIELRVPELPAVPIREVEPDMPRRTLGAEQRLGVGRVLAPRKAPGQHCGEDGDPSQGPQGQKQQRAGHGNAPGKVSAGGCLAGVKRWSRTGTLFARYMGEMSQINDLAPPVSVLNRESPDTLLPFEGEPANVRFSEVVSALSYALDITEGQPPGHAVRTCLIGMRMGDVIRLSPEERSALFYALLLKDLGCSSNAARLSRIFKADDLALKQAHKLTDWSRGADSARYSYRHARSGGGRLARAWQTVLVGLMEQGSGREMTETRCERGADIAKMLGLAPAT